MSRATNRKAVRPTPPAVIAAEAKRATAYMAMEAQLRDCQRWVRLAETLSHEDEEGARVLVAEHAADELDKLVAAYYAIQGFSP